MDDSQDIQLESLLKCDNLKCFWCSLSVIKQKNQKIKKQTKYFYEKRIFESDKLCDGCMVIPLVFEDTSCFVELEFKKNPLFFAKNLKKKFSKLLSIFLRNFS